MIIYLTAPTISDRSFLVVALVGVTTALVAMFSDQPAAAVVVDFCRLDWDKQHYQQDGRQEDGAKRVIFFVEESEDVETVGPQGLLQARHDEY